MIRFLIIVLSLMMGTAALAREAQRVEPGKVATSISPSSGTVGQRFTLELRTATQVDARVSVTPLDGDEQTTWALVEKPEVRRQKDGNLFVHQASVTIAPFLTGELAAPQFAVEWKDAAGSTVTLLSEPLPVAVESVLPPTTGTLQLKSTKAPIALPVPVSVIIAGWVLVGLVVLAVLIFAYRRWGHKVRALMQPLSPDAEALSQLARLEDEKLIEQKRVKEYYTRLSDALRAYAGQLYEVPALDLTTSELLAATAEALEKAPAEQKESLTKVVGPLEEVLSEADLVKFARHYPSERQARQALDHAREIVTSTRFKFAPQPENKAAALQSSNVVRSDG